MSREIINKTKRTSQSQRPGVTRSMFESYHTPNHQVKGAKPIQSHWTGHEEKLRTRVEYLPSFHAYYMMLTVNGDADK